MKKSAREMGAFYAWGVFAAVTLLACDSTQRPGGRSQASAEDPYLWLEEVEGQRALEWVGDQNKKSLAQLQADPRYLAFEDTAKKIFNFKDRIPMGSFRRGYVYNFWQDEVHVRGLWRRAKLADYLKKEIRWETLLDLDELSKTENENWVYKGVECLPPHYERCLMGLSRGGKDAQVYREFDLSTRTFVKDGFFVPEAKSELSWVDENTVAIGTDFGPGTLTDSGYPRQVRIWKRGEPLSQARLIYEGQKTDVSVTFFKDFYMKGKPAFIQRGISFYESEYFLWKDGGVVPIPMPKDVELRASFLSELMFWNRSPWKGIPAGSLIAVPLEGKNQFEPEAVWTPDARSSLLSVAQVKDALLVSVLSEVKGQVWAFERGPKGWSRSQIALPATGTVSIVAAHEDAHEFFVAYEDFITPTSLYFTPHRDQKPKVVKSLAPQFDSKDLIVDQFQVASTDGEKIPYFIVHKKGIAWDGSNPTLLYAYGGFESPMLPGYGPVTGKIWLERGGVYVLANIRGGGEFGPRWHQAGLKENRQKVFDDLISVAQDLVVRKVTSPRRLGAMGGSNGGLLMGAMLTQRPDLFQAIVCQVPLLDMLRYHRLLAGASWMGEYGDPDDPSMRAVISKYSPYQNLKKEGKYPEVFLITSTKDDRVHPGHARKMVARMTEYGHPVLYFENTEGGHAANANLLQRAKRVALEFTYLTKKLVD